MSRINPRWAAAAASLALAFAASAHAQSTASLRGRVTDEQGAVVAGAQIAVKNQATGEERSTVSDRQGEYLVPALPVGSYRLEVQSTGFQVAVVQNLRVEVAQAAVQNVKLSVSGRTEEVAVVGETPAIETVTTSFGTVISQKTVQEIPLNGRHFVDLGLLIPGPSRRSPRPAPTAPLRGQGSFAFNAARRREGGFMINGINLNDQVQNRSRSAVDRTVAGFKVATRRSAQNTPALGARGEHRDARARTVPRRGVRVLPRRVARRAQLLQPREPAAVDVQPQPVRREPRRPDPQEQDLLLPELRGPAPAPGPRLQQRRPERRRARWGHRPRGAQPAAPHPDGERDERDGRSALHRHGVGKRQHRPVHGRRRTVRPERSRHAYYACG